MSVRFIHVRDHDIEGNVQCTGGATIGYTVTRMADMLTIRWAAAHCLPADAYDDGGDRFIKAIGREIAIARLNDSKWDSTIVIGADMEKQVEAKVYEDFLEMKMTFSPDIARFYYPIKRSFDLRKVNPDAILHVDDPDFEMETE